MDKNKILEAHPFLNDYLIKYADFISEKATEQNLLEAGLFEKHHIFPKSIFGDNDYLVNLSYADHFMAHWYLYKAYREIGGVPFRSMCYALVSFTRTKTKSRKYKLSNMSDDDIRTISYLLEYTKIANKEGSSGELNPFYGKSHSPETISKKQRNALERGGFYTWSAEHYEKYSTYLNCRDHKDVAKYWYYNPETNTNTRLSANAIENNNIPEGYIAGKCTSEQESLKRSFAIRETYSHNPPVRPKGEDSPHYKSFHYYNPETGKRIRLKESDIIPSGYIRGFYISEEVLVERNRKIGDALRGVVKPYMQIVNRDPEKIRKTAEKNRGSKRTEEQKANISASLKGIKPPNTGKKLCINLKTGEKCNFLVAEIPEGWDIIHKKSKMKIIIHAVTNEKKFIPYEDEIPEGWIKWKKKHPKKEASKK